jgi:hypothetical protein
MSRNVAERTEEEGNGSRGKERNEVEHTGK